jgi:hypothetical protein
MEMSEIQTVEGKHYGADQDEQITLHVVKFGDVWRLSKSLRSKWIQNCSEFPFPYLSRQIRAILDFQRRRYLKKKDSVPILLPCPISNLINTSQNRMIIPIPLAQHECKQSFNEHTATMRPSVQSPHIEGNNCRRSNASHCEIAVRGGDPRTIRT